MRLKSQIRWILTWLTLLLAMAAAGQAQAAASAKSVPAIQAVASISTTVADMDRSVAFYAGVLSFQKVSDQEIELADAAPGMPALQRRVVRMRMGDETIELVQFEVEKAKPIPADSRSDDLWFQHIAIIVSDMDRAYAVLQANRVQAASVAPQRLPDWNKNAAGIRAYYFKDPDGHPLEILQFPTGKGDPKWHRNAAKLFLGIDHTAIVVSNTDASLKFYRDVLGMRVAGESDNYGIEQEDLNNVPGAHLRITLLRAGMGPGIELLEYLSPRNGRHLPYEPGIADLVHRQTLLIAVDPAALAKALQTTLARPPHVVGTSTFTVRDPDGHALLIGGADIDSTIGEAK